MPIDFGRVVRLIVAANRLVNKLDRVHADPKYQSVWSINQLHAGPYDGPTWTNELEELRYELEWIREGDTKEVTSGSREVFYDQQGTGTL